MARKHKILSNFSGRQEQLSISVAGVMGAKCFSQWLVRQVHLVVEAEVCQFLMLDRVSKLRENEPQSYG